MEALQVLLLHAFSMIHRVVIDAASSTAWSVRLVQVIAVVHYILASCNPLFTTALGAMAAIVRKPMLTRRC